MIFNKLISLFFLPGIVVHELSHKFFCDWAGVKVLKVRYFRFGNPSGYVIHEQAEKFFQSFFISVGPFIIGTIFSLIFFALQENYARTPRGFVFLWLAIAIAANSFPSSGDAKALWQQTKKQIWHDPFAILGLPVSFAIWIVSLFGFLRLNYLYAGLLLWFVNSRI